jgi:hypothetical protein
MKENLRRVDYPIKAPSTEEMVRNPTSEKGF